MALLGSQTRTGRVELLGYDAEELGLVLRPVAVGGSDVHHLQRSKERTADRDRWWSGGVRVRNLGLRGLKL